MGIGKHLLAGALLATVVGSSIVLAQSPSQQSPPTGYGMMGNGGMGPGMMNNGMSPGMMGYGVMGPGMMGRGMMGRGMMGPGMMMGYGPMMQGQLAYLKAELDITDAQNAAWQGYVDALQKRATTIQGMHATMMQAWQSGTALDRMDARIQAMQSMLDSMKAIKPATEALYNALTADQKKKADLLLGNGCCMM